MAVQGSRALALAALLLVLAGLALVLFGAR